MKLKSKVTLRQRHYHVISNKKSNIKAWSFYSPFFYSAPHNLLINRDENMHGVKWNIYSNCVFLINVTWQLLSVFMQLLTTLPGYHFD